MLLDIVSAHDLTADKLKNKEEILEQKSIKNEVNEI